VSELGKLKAELGNTVAHLERTERLLQASEREVKILQQENEKLHDIVLNQAGTQKVSDDEIVQHFLKIRQSLQKLARNSSFSLDGELVVLEAIEDNAMAEFYDEANWGHLSVRDRAYRVRAKIFEMLNCNILSNQSFGSSGIDSEGVIENGLQRLENSLKKRKRRCQPVEISSIITPMTQNDPELTILLYGLVDHDMIDDWRVATIRCVEECNDGDEETSFATAQRIFNFFAPILSRGFDEASEKRFDSHLIELCQDMYRLSMVMRSSRGGYKCRAVMQKSHRGQKFASIEDWAEAVAVDAGKDNEAGETVAYMLFGALVKYQQGKPMKVLEKAQVVLKREK